MKREDTINKIGSLIQIRASLEEQLNNIDEILSTCYLSEVVANRLRDNKKRITAKLSQLETNMRPAIDSLFNDYVNDHDTVKLSVKNQKQEERIITLHIVEDALEKDEVAVKDNLGKAIIYQAIGSTIPFKQDGEEYIIKILDKKQSNKTYIKTAKDSE